MCSKTENTGKSELGKNGSYGNTGAQGVDDLEQRKDAEFKLFLKKINTIIFLFIFLINRLFIGQAKAPLRVPRF